MKHNLMGECTRCRCGYILNAFCLW